MGTIAEEFKHCGEETSILATRWKTALVQLGKSGASGEVSPQIM